VDQEPVFGTDESRRKPDLVCSKGGKVNVVDAQIVSGATSLDERLTRGNAIIMAIITALSVPSL